MCQENKFDPYPLFTDAELVDSSQAGDLEAFEELIKRHEQKVFDLLYLGIHDHQESEDRTNETFVNAFRYLYKITEGENTFRNLIIKIAMDKIKDYWKEKIRRDKILRELSHQRSYHPQTLNVVAIRERIAALPKEEQQALVIYYFNHSTLEALAQQLRMSTAQACRLVQRLREHMQEILTEKE